MFYTLLQPHGAQVVSASVKAWANALDAWRAAYLKAVETPMAAAQAMAHGETPRFDASATAPADLAALTMTAWTETMKAATAGAHAAFEAGPMTFEANPFGLTGLFTVEPPSAPATSRASNVVSIPVADVHARKLSTARDIAPKTVAAPVGEAPKPGKPSAPRRIAAAEAPNPLPPRSAAPDDLTLIKGVGPKLAEALHAAGVDRFDQLAALDPAGVAHLEQVLKSTGRVAREDWIGQARALMSERSPR
jgi:predicted flap endonuclease-1-like 5' DNA nuclease